MPTENLWESEYLIQYPDYSTVYTIGVRYPAVAERDFLLFTAVFRPILTPTNPCIQCILVAFLPEMKRTGREADHFSLSSAYVKNACFRPPMTWCLIKYRDKFTFYFYLNRKSSSSYSSSHESRPINYVFHFHLFIVQ
jgi:hypothetical protein